MPSIESFCPASSQLKLDAAFPKCGLDFRSEHAQVGGQISLMRLAEARDRVPLQHFLQQRAFGLEYHALQAVPSLCIFDLIAAIHEHELHFPIAGYAPL
jgi:hypothetical protein